MASSNSLPLNIVGYTTPPPKHSSTFLITVTLLALTVTVSLALYLLLRYLNCCIRRRVSPSPSVTATVFPSSHTTSTEISINTASSAVDSLPVFTFSSVNRRDFASGAGDCAVCLSKFEQRDLLRLLPLCCHAFHRECIDTWLRSNLTCPLCRSAVFASESDVMKILRSPSTAAGNSFRLEIGNVSHREADGETRGRILTTSSRRSYSIGSFEYLIDEEAEIIFGDAQQRSVTGEKDDVVPVELTAGSEQSFAGDVASGRSWLKDYVDQLSASLSRTVSFRSSGRFFTGSSRRNDVVGGGGDYDAEVETNRVGEEISEMFHWLSSGV